MESPFYNEFNASVEMGSGFVSVVGPPGCGKTQTVLTYLTEREWLYQTSHQAAIALGHGVVPEVVERRDYNLPTERAARAFHVEYLTGTGTTGDTLARLTRSLAVNSPPRRIAAECSPLEFGNAVRHWLASHGAQSELHLVIDDADHLREETAQIDLWLSNCFGELTQSRTLCLWLVSQFPLHIKNCFRFHFLPSPSVDTVCRWIDSVYHRNREWVVAALEVGEGEEASLERELSFADTAHSTLAKAMRYYSSRLPMSASLVCKDVRQLLQRVFLLLPSLLSTGQTEKLNALHFSTAWGHYNPGNDPLSASRGRDPSEGGDRLVQALQKTGYSAVLLAFCAFYCGSVAPSKLAKALGGSGVLEFTTTTETNRNSHRSAVLSASTHRVTPARLSYTYNALVQICIQSLDPSEFCIAELALQHVTLLETWGLLTPSPTTKGMAYYCWISLTTALQLGKLLNLNLYDLIPA